MQTVYAWDGGRVLSIPGQYWWSLESDYLEEIAFAILYDHTADRELAEGRAKAFALEILRPLVTPSMIVESAIDAWLLAPASGPAPVRHPVPGTLAIRCAGCSVPIPVAARHFGLLSVFRTLCDACRGVAA